MQNIPAYVIHELLVRLTNLNHTIGEYRNHSFQSNGVLVRTSTFDIYLPEEILEKQLATPEIITIGELQAVAFNLK